MTRAPAPHEVRDLADWLYASYAEGRRGSGYPIVRRDLCALVEQDAATLLRFRSSRMAWLWRDGLGVVTPLRIGRGINWMNGTTLPFAHKLQSIISLNPHPRLPWPLFAEIAVRVYPDCHIWTPNETIWWRLLMRQTKTDAELVALTV